MDSGYRVQILDAAASDLRSVIEWYEDRKEGLGLEFYQNFNEITERVSVNPFLYQNYHLFIRRAVMTRFSFNVYYAVDEVNFVVEVIAVFHQKMSLAELRQRINLE